MTKTEDTALSQGQDIAVRPAEAADESSWRRLWAGYTEFYGADVPEAVTAHTWRRILDPSSPVFARVAVLDGVLSGFSVSVLHEGTWTVAPACYLEDLFVAPESRGRGVGAALIRDLIDSARREGWARLYWHTQTHNATARALYDKFCAADDYVRYRLFLG